MSMSSDAYYEAVEEAEALIKDEIARWNDEANNTDSVYDEAYVEGFIDGLDAALTYLRSSIERAS